MAALTVQKSQKTKSTREKKRLLFYILMFALPLLQFLVFYIIVNFNSIIISFQKFTANTETLGYTTSFAGLDNFKVAWNFLTSSQCWEMTKFSLIFYACNLFIITPLALLFSFYIAKHYRFAGFFRVILYLPCVLSAIVLAILYRYVTTDALPYIMKNWFNVKMDPLFGGAVSQATQFKVILFYNLWLAFGINTMLYVGAMTDINPSLIEASQLDGAGPARQFIHVYVPMIWPTLVTFIVTGLAGLFIEQMNLYSFFADGGDNKFSTFGYFFFVQSHQNDLYTVADPEHFVFNYSQLAAMGILVTIALIPIVLIVRKLLLKYGPSSK